MKQNDFKVGFPIAAVWFGTMVGPSLLTGVFSSIYFAPYGGLWSILFMVFNVLISVIVVSTAAEVSRRNKAYHFGAMSKAMYGKYSPVFGPVLDILMICSVLVNAAALIAVWKTLVLDVFGMSPIFGTISIIIICTLLTAYGAGFVRKASSVMTVILFIGMMAIMGITIYLNQGSWGSLVSSTTPLEGFSVGQGFWKIFVLAFYNTTICMHLAAVNQTLESPKHSVAFGIYSFVLILFAFASTTTIILPYAADAVVAPVPMLAVIEGNFGSLSNVGKWIYSITMFFAIISSCVPTMQSCLSRVDNYLPRKGIFEKNFFRNALGGILYWVIAIAVSTMGLTAIVSRGWSVLGYVSVVLIVIPCVIIMPIKWRKSAAAKERIL